MSPARLVVALEPDEDSLLLVEGYARLAAELQRELVALVVEDAALGAAMALPFGRIQPRRATADAEFGPSTARHALRVFRARIEGRMAEACRQLGVRWSFAVAHHAPAAGDILVYGPRGPAAGAPPAAACPVILSRATGRTVVVLYEGSAETLTLGNALARRERLPLSVLAVADDPGTASRLAVEAAALGHPAQLVTLQGGGEPLARLLAAARPRAVIVDACNSSIRLAGVVAALA
jgi:hypothetical protein